MRLNVRSRWIVSCCILLTLIAGLSAFAQEKKGYIPTLSPKNQPPALAHTLKLKLQASTAEDIRGLKAHFDKRLDAQYEEIKSQQAAAFKEMKAQREQDSAEIKKALAAMRATSADRPDRPGRSDIPLSAWDQLGIALGVAQPFILIILCVVVIALLLQRKTPEEVKVVDQSTTVSPVDLVAVKKLLEETFQPHQKALESGMTDILYGRNGLEPLATQLAAAKERLDLLPNVETATALMDDGVERITERTNQALSASDRLIIDEIQSVYRRIDALVTGLEEVSKLLKTI